MDQVDKIIIDTLNTLGCELEEMSSLSQFGLEEVVQGVVQCLRVASSDTCSDLSHKLPLNMAHRFRAAAAIAQHVKALGYSADLGYQSLLYPNVVDIRRLFSFLLEKLPKDTAELHQEPLSGAGLLLTSARKELRSQLSRPWIPPHCRMALLNRRKQALQQQLLQQPDPTSSEIITTKTSTTELVPLGETRHLRPFQALNFLRIGSEMGDGGDSNCAGAQRPSAAACSKKIATNERILICSILAAHARQMQVNQLLPSVSSMSKNISIDSSSSSKGLDPLQPEQYLNVPSPSTDSLVTPLSPLSPMANLSLTDTAKQQVDQGAKEEKNPKETLENMEQLRVSLATLCQQKQEQLAVSQTQKETLQSLSSELQELEESEKEVQDELVSLQRTLELLPSSQENRTRLEAVIASSDAKMTKLKQQFTDHCTPLQQCVEQLTKELQAKQSEREELTVEIHKLRQQRQCLQQEAPAMQQQTQLITEKLRARGQAVNRSVYTKRILEITAAVHQQRQTTESVIQDIRKLQKEINSVAGKIDRSFTVIEEVSYKASWTNNTSVGLYRRVINLHDDCSAIVDIIRETGAIKRQVAELSEQVMLEERRETAKALVKLQGDLADVKQENAALKARLA